MILVTGGAGYIGSHFIRAYLEKAPNAAVVAVDNLSEGHKESLPDTSHVYFLHKDAGNVEALKAVFERFPIRAVVHFAASCYVGESEGDPIKYFKNNVVQSLNLFEAMEETGVRKIVFSSSCATYGNPEYSPLDERHRQEPVNVYGRTKLMVEQTLQALVTRLGWSCVSLRYFNAAGADDSGQIGESHEPETHLIPLALQTAKGERQSLKVYGNDYDTEDGTCIRDYIHVNDLADAHCQALKLLENGKRWEAINLGTTSGASVLQIIEMCRQVTGKDIPYEIAPRRPGDPPCLVAESSKAASLLDWKPKYDLRRIIETAWSWEQNRRF